MIKELMNFD